MHCPERVRYDDIMAKLRAKHTRRSDNREQRPIFSSDRTAFPPLNRPSANQDRSPLYQHYRVADLQRATQRFNPMMTSTNNTNQINGSNHSNSYSNRTNCNQNLFSAQELMAIMRELIVKLRSCQDRLDQLEVISHLALRFIGNGP